ncbi:helix-turn-helix domain-containing protein [Roseomonas populi]|uniref:Helix-turn-helix domain-containing protein n=1 Tax=Roseomonas populi TaxID=3121582 RepID=A0ABT1XAB4_9PROT|nr:helix-turn-helix transcriptional regulator [Roseomonas pecuniae]MCR0985025.1 helix-turn-helix domain-containing protein [Roseomonas pecuniae]
MSDLRRYPGIGERLRAHRMASGLTADDMAARLGISRTALYRYERGEPPKLPTLERAAALLNLPLGTLLGVGAEWFASAGAFFERLRQLEETAEHIFVLFGTGSFLLTSDAYDLVLPDLVRETLPPGTDPAPLLATLQARKAAYRRRRPSIAALVSLPEIRDALREGIAGTASLSEVERERRRSLARHEAKSAAVLAEAPPRGVQVAVLQRPVPSTGFSMARGRGETSLAISPFRIGAHANLSAGIAMVTRAPDAVRLHDEVADSLWREAAKGEAAARLIRAALEAG